MATATFLFADIVGSTRLWDAHPEAMKAALATHDEIATKVVDAEGGRVFKHTGDGFIAVFDTAGPALDAATAFQRALAASPLPDVGRLHSRIGVHAGEAEERDGDYFGATLNRAARLMSAAHGGQILVSVVARRLAGEGANVGFQDLGEHRLRDLSEPEHVFQVLAEGLTTEFPQLVTADTVPNNLPTLTSSFVGREQEMEEVAKLVRGARVVTISGVGGAGKTRLALQVAAEIGAEFDGGIWLIELAPITDPDKVEGTVARALGVAEQPGSPTVDAIVEHLATREALLILDNCEHVVDASADLVTRLTEGAPSLRIIATSRELLGVPGEVAFGLRSLGLPKGDVTDPRELLHHDAVRLFLERAAAAKPDYRLTADEAPAVAEICRRLDGMPLALELAAARLRTFSTGQIATNLDKRFRLLTGGSRTALPRQQTLAAAIDWSYRLLDDQERTLFERLSVFVGGFTLESATRVCADEGIDEFTILELLPALVDKSLVVADTSKAEARYTLLETIRQFARERFDESGAAEPFRLRHAEFFRDFAAEARNHLRGPDEAEWWDRIGLELENLRQSISWSIEADRPALALEIAGSFWRYWWFTSTWSEGVEILRRCVEAAEDSASDEVLAQGLLGFGSLLSWAPHPDDDIIAILMRATDMFRALEAAGAEPSFLKWNLAAAMINLSVAIEVEHGWNEEVVALNEEAAEAARRIGDPTGVTVALGNLAEGAAQSGDIQRTRALLDEATEITRGLQSQQRLVEVLWQRGLIEFVFENPGLAREAFDQALIEAEAGRLRQPAALSRAFSAIADIDEEVESAGDSFRAAVATTYSLAEDLDPTRLHIFIVTAMDLATREGRHQDAARLWGASDALTDSGSTLFFQFEGRRERARSAITEALGADAERFRAEGATWSRDEVIGEITRSPTP